MSDLLLEDGFDESSDGSEGAAEAVPQTCSTRTSWPISKKILGGASLVLMAVAGVLVYEQQGWHPAHKLGSAPNGVEEKLEFPGPYTKEDLKTLPSAGFMRDTLQHTRPRPKIVDAIDKHWETAEGRAKLKEMIESPNLPDFRELLNTAAGYTYNKSSDALQALHSIHKSRRLISGDDAYTYKDPAVDGNDGYDRSPGHLINHEDFQHQYGISKCVITALQATVVFGQMMLDTTALRRACDPEPPNEYDAVSCGGGITTFLDHMAWFTGQVATLPAFCGVPTRMPGAFCASDFAMLTGLILDITSSAFSFEGGICDKDDNEEGNKTNNYSVRARLERMKWLEQELNRVQGNVTKVAQGLHPAPPRSLQPPPTRQAMEDANARAIRKLPSLPGLIPVSTPNQPHELDRQLYEVNWQDINLNELPRAPLDPDEEPDDDDDSFQWILNEEPQRAAVNCAFRCTLILAVGSKTFVNLWNTVHVCQHMETAAGTELDRQACAAGTIDLVAMLSWWAMQMAVLAGACPSALQGGTPAPQSFCAADSLNTIAAVISFGEWGSVFTGDCNDEKGWAKGPGNPNTLLHPDRALTDLDFDSIHKLMLLR